MNNRQYSCRERVSDSGRAYSSTAWRSRIAAAMVFVALSGSTGAFAQSGAVSPESALELMRHGDCSGAMKQLERLRRSSPDDLSVAELSGIFLLDSGDAAGALAVYRDAITRAPAESLLSYGLAIGEIGSGDLTGAERALNACEQNDGNAEAIRVARRYIRSLRGDHSAQPEFKAAADYALDGMAAMRSSRHLEATALLQKAFAGDTGDPFLQSEGPLMSFEARKAIAPAFELVNTGKGVEAVERGTSGDLQLTPDEIPHGATYAAYELDGEALSIVGTRPFTYTWDTRLAANGLHKITIVLYNGAGDEIARMVRTVRVLNSGADSRKPVSDRDTALRAMFWQALILKPDRCACAYTAGSAFRALGDKAHARVWFARAAAIRADYRDTWARLQECGGVNRPGATVYSGRRDEKCVALTFDDGPKPGITEPLLDVLTAAHVTATFFVIGRHIQEYPELAKAISAAGMEIDNHSYTHRSLTAIGIREAEQEMLQTQAAVLAVIGTMPRYIRPPGGNWNNRVAYIARRWGLTLCMWSVDVFDAEIIGAQKVVETVLSQVRPGSIVLMHNGKVSTLQALPNILKVLRSRGYRFVTVDELARRSVRAAVEHGDVQADSRKAHTE